MAPVCWSSSRPLGVAAKFSRLSNKVSSQMSLKDEGMETVRCSAVYSHGKNAAHKLVPLTGPTQQHGCSHPFLLFFIFPFLLLDPAGLISHLLAVNGDKIPQEDGGQITFSVDTAVFPTVLEQADVWAELDYFGA